MEGALVFACRAQKVSSQIKYCIFSLFSRSKWPIIFTIRVFGPYDLGTSVFGWNTVPPNESPQKRPSPTWSRPKEHCHNGRERRTRELEEQLQRERIFQRETHYLGDKFKIKFYWVQPLRPSAIMWAEACFSMYALYLYLKTSSNSSRVPNSELNDSHVWRSNNLNLNLKKETLQKRMSKRIMFISDRRAQWTQQNATSRL